MVAWTRFLCPGFGDQGQKPGHKKRVQATIAFTPNLAYDEAQ